MELLKMTSESVISKKRPLDGSNDYKHRKIVPAVRDFPSGCGINEAERKPFKILTKAHSDLGKMSSDGDYKLVDSNCVENNKVSSKPKELGRNKSYVVSKPSGKVKYWEPPCTKAGYDQKPKVTVTHGPQKKVIKNFNNVDSNVVKMTTNGEDKLDKLVKSCPVENRKVKSFEPKELGRGKSYLGTRSAAKVKYWDPMCEAEKSEETTSVVSNKEKIRREKIKEAMAVFDQVYEPLHQENRMKPKSERIPSWRLPMEAAKIVKQKLKWMDPGKIVGPVCGVEIGDKFKYRSLLVMIGLHSKQQSGIDYANIEGKNLAISIVDAHRYSNDSGSSDKLIYSGQGGLGWFGDKLPAEDQKLERGNLAMKNSMDKKSPVRVIRKVGCFGKDVFVYDGLYIVDRYTNQKSAEGKIVFKFHLNRVPGQLSLHNMLKW